MAKTNDEGILKGIVNKVDPAGEAEFLLTSLGAGAKAYHTGEIAKIARLFAKPSVKYQDMGEARQAAYNIKFNQGNAQMLQGLLGLFKGGNKAMGEIAKRSGEGVCKDAVCALENSYKDMEKDTKTQQISGDFTYEVDGRDTKTGLSKKVSKTEGHTLLLTEKNGEVRLEDPINKFNQLFPTDVTTIERAKKYIKAGGLPLPHGDFKSY